MLTFSLFCLGSLPIALLQDAGGSDFTDLGRKLLLGFAAGVVVAIVFALIKLKLRDKHPATKFISVTSCADEEVTPKPVSD